MPVQNTNQHPRSAFGPNLYFGAKHESTIRISIEPYVMWIHNLHFASAKYRWRHLLTDPSSIWTQSAFDYDLCFLVSLHTSSIKSSTFDLTCDWADLWLIGKIIKQLQLLSYNLLLIPILFLPKLTLKQQLLHNSNIPRDIQYNIDIFYPKYWLSPFNTFLKENSLL